MATEGGGGRNRSVKCTCHSFEVNGYHHPNCGAWTTADYTKYLARKEERKDAKEAKTNFTRWMKTASPKEKAEYYARVKRAREFKRDPEKTVEENRKRLEALYGR